MNREEAVKILKESQLVSNKHDDVELSRAYVMALKALRGKKPDKKTGLMPCGCGSNNVEVTEFDGLDGKEYSVVCWDCFFESAGDRKKETAMNSWNIGMGYWGGSK